jgi:hypothetical protein
VPQNINKPLSLIFAPIVEQKKSVFIRSQTDFDRLSKNGSVAIMKIFIAVINQRTLSLKGENAIDALTKAGYIPMTQTTSMTKFVGVLNDGRHYSINFQPRTDKEK